ncbi:hypothetical protein [Morganella morganii]|uniref:hypothetical protein n=1 Tax=Morganella morganii TaxID=582 RepID=UPI00301DE661
MSIYNLVVKAIKEKMQIHATYQGKHREMCPHVIGTKNGREQALFFQFSGESSKGRIPEELPACWRCIVIAELEDVKIVSGEWHTGDNHSRPQVCVDNIDEQVDF